LSARDDLFQPSLQDHPGVQPIPRERPWRLGSQLWVAFFGGPLAIAIIAYLNARRLGVARARERAILALGLGVSLAYAVALVFWITPALAAAEPGSGERTLLRYSSRAVALVLYLGLRLLQRQADALYRFHRDAPESEIYAPLWVPGFLAGLFSLGAILALARIAG
jgi:hypothetical protein